MRTIKIVFFIYLILFSTKIFSAENKGDFEGKGGVEDHTFLETSNSNFKKGSDALRIAEKLKKKNKIKKANKRFNDSLKYFILAYEEVPNDPEILSFLSLVYYRLEDLMMSEIYLQEALALNSKSKTVNKRLEEINELILRAKKSKN
tara:strand:+ start:113 stop:553 length:441 start_codon:yes stop_codon:yes gene_type:complete